MPLKNEQIDGLCLKWANGNSDAASLLSTWANLVRLADNIADGDSDDPVFDMGSVIILATVELANNPFYLANAGAVGGAMCNAVTLWIKSEDWKRDHRRETRMFGYVWREAVEHVAYVVAMICGGLRHALLVAEEIQQLSHVQGGETFEQWEAS